MSKPTLSFLYKNIEQWVKNCYNRYDILYSKRNIREEFFMKKTNKKDQGFTLVELIVVIVILAILAAILVPALLGYIDRAKGNQDVINAKTYLTAAQAEFTSIYANPKKNTVGTSVGLPNASNTLSTDVINSIKNTADVEAYWVAVGTAYDEDDDHSPYKITYMVYQRTSSSKPIYYAESVGEWSTDVPTYTPDKTYTIVAKPQAGSSN